MDKHTKELTELRSQITLTKSPPHLQAPVVNNQPLTSQNNVMPSDRGIRRNNLIITGIELGSEDPKIFLQGFIAARFSTRSDGILAVQKINIDTTTSQTQPIHAPILSKLKKNTEQTECGFKQIEKGIKKLPITTLQQTQDPQASTSDSTVNVRLNRVMMEENITKRITRQKIQELQNEEQN